MQRTLLQVVQNYLDRTNGFYVNSINDTDESLQIAKIAEDVYYKMVQEFPNLLFTMKERTLDSVSDPERPNYMLLPKNVQKVQESKIYYNISTEGGKIDYREITYLPPLEFVSSTNNTSSTETLIVEGYDENKMVVPTKKFPSYCTSFDNQFVVFDSYHSDYESSLQASKTRIVVSEEEVFLQDDNFIIPIPDHLSETYLDMFLNEAMTFIYQQSNPLLATRARAAKIKLQQDNRTLGSSRKGKRYGRKGLVGSYVPRGHGH
ncbi:MAG: hypothetical protein Unbinned96contig1001_41 [Prokaryotic dsDNA virus sp.]|nr:MAG: hypothetical protein Unbinned96contig1001_41 [Prokaryotic dsDNA virus sp.]|tara:strand:- start:29724 stop:30509 length:786 start_codon:yes stop_codon:yes gene_type:complete